MISRMDDFRVRSYKSKGDIYPIFDSSIDAIEKIRGLDFEVAVIDEMLTREEIKKIYGVTLHGNN